LFLSTNSANAASRHIMIGIPELKYKEVLCGLLYLRYSPYTPLHSLLLSPSHIKPKLLVSNSLANSSGGNDPLYSICLLIKAGEKLGPNNVNLKSGSYSFRNAALFKLPA